MKKNKFILLLVLCGLLFVIYRNWFIVEFIIGGDWPFFYPENIREFSFLPPAWNSIHGNGFGGPHIVYALDTYLYLTGWFFSNVLQIPWHVVYRIVWFIPAIVLSLFSICTLTKQLGFKIPILYLLPGMLLYIANTYILMVLGGGQLGVGLGYAIAPLVLSNFIELIRYEEVKNQKLKVKNAGQRSKVYASVLAGIVLSIQVLFDFRIAYITLLAIGIYYLLNIRRNLFQFTYTFIIPFIVAGLLHAFWIIPFLFIGQSSVTQLGTAYTSSESLKFFSFALFENAFGLLHPNWPENIFGKVGFMKPEYLLLPIIVFSSLLFAISKFSLIQKKNVLFFTFTALLGIFLAKGANDPFGNLYIWMFESVPGFVMFRDPTKWYSLIAISYSVLLPVSIFYIYEYLSSKFKDKKSKIQIKIQMYLPLTLNLLVILYLIFLIKPSVLGDLGGTFTKHEVPAEYVKLKNTLVNDDAFSRTLWIPRQQRFGFTSQNHPAVEAFTVFNATNSADIINQMNRDETKKKLADLSIKYVVIPFDSEQELFLKDRKFNNDEPEKIEYALDKLGWLKKDKRFNALSVYTLKDSKDSIYLTNEGSISYNKNTSTNYSVKIRSQQNNTVVFNESYSPYWRLVLNGKEIQSINYKGFNSYEIPPTKNEAKLIYTLQDIYRLGSLISLVSLLIVLNYLILKKLLK